MNRISPRERLMLFLVAGIVLILGGVFLFSTLSARYSQITADLASKQTQLKALTKVIAEQDLWAQREAWLNSKQPKLSNRDQAGVLLLNDIKSAAKGHNVAIEKQELSSAINTQPSYQSVAVVVQTKSSWENLLGFMNDLQQPEHFLVFETAKMQIDPTDPTQMRGEFRVAKWFAP